MIIRAESAGAKRERERESGGKETKRFNVPFI